MTEQGKRPQPTWTDVKGKLAGLDRTALLGLVRDLYAASKENQAFLHARFGLGGDVLEPYKRTIDRWLWPDVLRKQDTSVAKAKAAITDYKRAVGDPAGLAELMVFYCEQAVGFCRSIVNDDETYMAALVRMFEQALAATKSLPASAQAPLTARLQRVRDMGQKLGYGAGENMDSVLAQYAKRRA